MKTASETVNGQQPPPSKERILRLPEVLRRTGLSRSSIYERMSYEAFPQNVNLGGRSVGWLESEVEAWIEERAQQRSKMRRSHPATQQGENL